MRSPTACLLYCGPSGPAAPRWLAFAQAGLSAQIDRWSGGRTRGYGTAELAANQSRAPG